MTGVQVVRSRPTGAQARAAARFKKSLRTWGESARRLRAARERIARQELQEAKDALNNLWARQGVQA